MKIQFSKITGHEVLDYELELKEPLLVEASSIKTINSAKGTITLEKADDVYIIKYDIEASLTVYSSITNEPFEYLEEISDTIYYTDKEEFASNEVFYVDESYIDIDKEVFSLIITSLPITLHKEGEEYPSGENYRVMTEEEYEKEHEGNHFFDALDDLLEDDN